MYAHPGSYTVRLTVTNSAGTSTTQVFTGQTVSNQGGPQATTTHTVAVATPTVSALKVSPTTFSLAGRKVNGKCVKATAKNSGKPRCSRQIELKVGYTLNAADTVTLTLRRQSPGRKVKGRCVKPTEANKKHKPCTRLIALNGQISLTGATGANGFRFNGKIGGHTLGPGTYRLIAAPADGAPRAVRFKIAG